MRTGEKGVCVCQLVEGSYSPLCVPSKIIDLGMKLQHMGNSLP